MNGQTHRVYIHDGIFFKFTDPSELIHTNGELGAAMGGRAATP